ncbi:hypothetical protein AMATHDRAFT_83918, partial [Amanita thiersii Skay4041]
MSSLHLSVEAWRGATVTLHLLAIFTTSFRLFYRYRSSIYWWDDHWAAFALFLEFGFFSTVWMRASHGVPAYLATTEVRVARYWVGALLYPSVVWASRVSIGLSILRIVPYGTLRRRLLIMVLFSFSLMWLALMLQKIIVCTSNTTWHYTESKQCLLGEAVGIITLSTDVFADSCLVSIPLHMLRELKLPRPERRLVHTIFCASVLSSMASVVYATFVFKADTFAPTQRGLLVGLTSHLKGTITLMVCNFLVIIPCIYRLLKREDGDWHMSVTFDIVITRARATENHHQPHIPLENLPALDRVQEAAARCPTSSTFQTPFNSMLASRVSSGAVSTTGQSLHKTSLEDPFSRELPSKSSQSPDDRDASEIVEGISQSQKGKTSIH